MKTRIFTHVECPCGHRGALIESIDANVAPDGWRQAWLRNLNHAGDYDGDNELFAETRPGCPACGRSLGPDNVVGRSETQRAAVRFAGDAGVPEATLGAPY